MGGNSVFVIYIPERERGSDDVREGGHGSGGMEGGLR